jgi:hypothetical protein
MSLGRKASYARLAIGVICIAGLIILIFFIAKVRFFSGSLVEDSKCKNSILNHVAAQKATGGDVETTITCKTNYYKAKSSNEEEAKFAMAEALKACWATWGRGEVQLFSKDAVYCHVCSVTSFDTDGKNMNAQNFPQYLATKKIDAGNGQGLTYGQYLNYFATEESETETLQNLNKLGNTGSIDLTKSYATIFVYVRGNNYITDYLKAMDPTGTGSGSITTGIAGGVAGGALGVLTLKGLTVIGIGIGGPFTWLVGGAIVGATALIALYAENEVDYLSMTMLREYNAEELQKIGCKIAPVAQDSQRRSLG